MDRRHRTSLAAALKARLLRICAAGAVLLVSCAGARAQRPGEATIHRTIPRFTTEHAVLFADCGRDGFNNGIEPAVFVRHVDFCEGDPYSSADYMQALRLAGLPYASFYTDTWFNAACLPPYKEPAGPCKHEPASELPGRASAFLHNSDGVRLYREYERGLAQEALNLLDPEVVAAIRNETQGFLRGACTLCNLFETDDTGTDFSRGWYDFNSLFSVEITTPEQFARAHEAQIHAYPRQVYFNGIGAGFDSDGPQSHPLLERWLRDPQVIGAESEGCWNPNLSESSWIGEQHAIRFVTARSSKRVFCLNYENDTAAKRIFATASLWLEYVPGKTVMWKENSHSPDRTRSGHVISGPFREDEIVPEYALTTGPIESMQSGGAYAREFAGCYWSNRSGLANAGRLIGPCAAVVNPTAGALPLPPMRQRYDHTLTLDAHTVFNGGTARFDGSLPHFISAQSALILGP